MAKKKETGTETTVDAKGPGTEGAETEALETQAEGTDVAGIEGTAAEGTENAEGTAEDAAPAPATDAKADEIDPEKWAAMTPQEKLAFQKERARKAAARTNKSVGSRSKSGEDTIGSVACQAIRDGATNDEVLLRVFERFPSAKTSVASVTWYRNSLKSAGENIKSSREIMAARNKAAGDAGNADDGTSAPAPATGLSEEDQAALDALEAEGGEGLSNDDLEGLLS